MTENQTTIQVGDRVWVRGADPDIYTVLEIQPARPALNDEAIALFEGGGFWRVSGLQKVPANARADLKMTPSGYRPADMIAADLMRAKADTASAFAQMRREVEHLRDGLRDLIEDDTRPSSEMRDVARAILDGTFRRSST